MSNIIQKFYLEGRTKVAFPNHTTPIYPVVATLEEWNGVRSSKVDLLVKLLHHHLLDDKHQQVDWVDVDGLSVPMWRDAGGCPMEGGPREVDTSLMTLGTRKILIYHEFPMMAPLLVSVSDLYVYHLFTMLMTIEGIEASSYRDPGVERDARCRREERHREEI